MEDNKNNKTEKKKVFKRKLLLPKAMATSTTSTAFGHGSGSKATSSAVSIVRKALKIPTNYEAFAAKQLHNYKHSKAQEMFKERNKKYTCVEDRVQQSGAGSISEAQPPSAPLESFLDESTRELIKNYEQSHPQAEISGTFMPPMPGSSSGGHVYVGERPEKFLTMPVFDPTVPPPAIPLPLRMPMPPFASPSSTPVSCSQSAPKQQPKGSAKKAVGAALAAGIGKEVKREPVDAEMQDEIPSFQSPPSASQSDANAANAVPHPLKTESAFQEDEEKKQKQALLWSLCQEELTVTSAIAGSTKRLELIQRKLDHYQRALATEQAEMAELERKKEQLAQRRVKLLQSAGESWRRPSAQSEGQ